MKNIDIHSTLGDNGPVAKLHWGHNLQVLQELIQDNVKVQSVITELPSYGLSEDLPQQWPNFIHKDISGNVVTTLQQDTTLGLEETLEDYIAHIVLMLDKCRDVLKTDGTLWLAVRDRYSEDKNLAMIPARVALTLQQEGWILRNDIIWKWNNPHPESVKDRLTRTYGHVFMFAHPESKGQYTYYQDNIREQHLSSPDNYKVVVSDNVFNRRPDAKDAYPEGGKNKRDVWECNLGAYRGPSNSPWPYDLVKPMVLASTQEGDTVLDILSGTAMTGKVCIDNGRSYIGIDSKDSVRGEALARLQGVVQSNKAKQNWGHSPVLDMFSQDKG